jgi:hypothetical protein
VGVPSLTNKDRRALLEALTEAITDNDDLEVFVYLVAGRPADQLAPAGALPARLTRLLLWAEANGEIDTVIAMAHQRAPNNARLKALVSSQPASAAPPVSMPVADAPVPSDLADELYGSLDRLRRAVSSYRETAFGAVRLVRRVRVRGQDAYLEYEETIENQSGSPCAELVRFVASDSPTDFRNLEFRSELEFPGEAPLAAAVRHTTLKGGRLFRVRVGFRDKLVEPGGTLTLRSFCTLRASVAKNDEYFVFPFMFSRPARLMILDMQFEQAPAEIHLFRVVEQDDQPALRAVPLPRARALNDVTGGTSYRVEFPDVLDTYLFSWTARDDG